MDTNKNRFHALVSMSILSAILASAIAGCGQSTQGARTHQLRALGSASIVSESPNPTPSLTPEQEAARQAKLQQIANEPVPTLEAILALLRGIEPFLEDLDVPRCRMLERAVQLSAESVNTLGKSNFETMKRFQIFFVQFEFSRAYLKLIESDRVSRPLAKINESVELMKIAFGFDKSPYSQIVKSTMMSMKAATDELTKQSLPENLMAEIAQLNTLLGTAIAMADQGDRPKAFAAGDAVYQKVRAIESQLWALSGSGQVFELAKEVLALCEFYADYAQIERAAL